MKLLAIGKSVFCPKIEKRKLLRNCVRCKEHKGILLANHMRCSFQSSSRKGENMKEMECTNKKCYDDSFHIHILNCGDILAICANCGSEEVIGVQSSYQKVNQE